MADPGPAAPPCRETERPRRTHFLLLLFGMFSIAMLLATDRFRYRGVARDTLLEATVAEVKTEVTLAHLWVEERVSGDDVPVEEIDEALADAVQRVEAMLGEGLSDGVGIPAQLVDPELHALGEELLGHLEEFRRFATLRRRSFDRGLPVGIGSFADKAFDFDFRRVFDMTETLRQRLSANRIANERRSWRTFQAVLGGWIVVVAAATLALRSREQQRVAAQRALLASQEQLFQSQKMEAMGRLAGGLAHDINNYLAAIRGHCELVRMTNPSGEKLTRRMDGAIQVVDKASSLLTRLLSISHRQPLAIETLDLNALVTDLGRVFKPTLEPAIQLETDLAKDLWPVDGDPSQLEQVLSNLVVNARDAMDRGGRVRIVTRNQPSDGGPDGRDEVWVEVQDTGAGIAPELLSRIFEPFLTTKGGKANAGLGLAVVYGIVRQSNGRIEVTSQLGRGTTFRIRLPRSSHSLPVSQPVRHGTAPSGTEHLLLVDDNLEFRDSTADWLRALGYRVTTAESAEEAMALLPQGGIHLVVSDVVLGGLSGPAFLQRVAETNPELPVLLISGHDSASVVSPADSVNILAKEKINELGWRIRAALDRS